VESFNDPEFGCLKAEPALQTVLNSLHPSDPK
jgi:hypothetical protein